MKSNETLKSLRKKKGLTQDQVAKKLHVSRSTYAQYESGKRAVTADMFFEILRIFEEEFSLHSQKDDFFNAIVAGDLKTVVSIVQTGFDIETTNDDGHRAFLLSIVHNHLDILTFLIKKGSPYHSEKDIVWREHNGHDKLLFCLIDGHLEIAKLILESSFDLTDEVEFLKSKYAFFLPTKSQLLLHFHLTKSKLPVHSIESFAKKIEEKQREVLIKEHLHIAEYCINKFSETYTYIFCTKEQLTEAAMNGLKKAAEKFDFSKGYFFKTYCTWWIRQNILIENQKHSNIPTVYLDLYIRLEEHYHSVLRKQNKKLTKDELCLDFNITLEKLDRIEKDFPRIVFWKE